MFRGNLRRDFAADLLYSILHTHHNVAYGYMGCNRIIAFSDRLAPSAVDPCPARFLYNKNPMPLQLTPKSGGFALTVKVVPGSSRQKIAGEYAGGIKVNVRQPPEAGYANEAVIALLADVLKIPTANIQITRGHASPRKEVHIAGLSADLIRQRLSGKFKS